MDQTPPVTPLETVKPIIPVSASGKRLFTKENAALFGRIGALKRAETMRQRKEIAERTPQEKRTIAVNYVESELVCVRRQIEKLNRKIMTCPKPQDLHWLISAMSKLREQERILDGRPLPGQLRPKGETRQDRKTGLQPLDAEPLANVA